MDRIIAGRGRAPLHNPALPAGLGEALASRRPPVLQPSSAERIQLLRDLCDTMKYGSLCALGGFTPYPVLSALDYFPEDFDLSRVREAAE